MPQKEGRADLAQRDCELMKRILSFYADHKAGYVFVKDENQQKSYQENWIEGRASNLLLVIQKVWHSGCAPDVIMAPRGPASFTTLRTILTIAKGFAFSFPKAKLFTPSQFHVLAFCAKPKDQPFFVALDAFNHGFYGAVMQNTSETALPQFITEPAFFHTDSGTQFLHDHNIRCIVTDFAQNSKCAQFLQGYNVIIPTAQFAKTQFELYQSLQGTDLLKGDLASLAPFYGHMPSFKKTVS